MKQPAILFALSAFFLLSCNNESEAPENQSVTSVDSLQTPSSTISVDSLAGTKETSIENLEKEHALFPSEPDIAYDLAYAYAEGKDAKSISLSDSLIKTKTPEIEKAYYSKATYFFGAGNYKEALKNYNLAITANYRFFDAHLDKGKLLLQQKQYDEALKSFAIGQEVLPQEAQFYLWMAKTQEAMGNKQDAKTNYETAYALDKNLVEAKEAAEKLE